MRSPTLARATTLLCAALALGAALGGAVVAASALALAAALLVWRTQSDQAHARAGWSAAVLDLGNRDSAASTADASPAVEPSS
jgi:hypothetical protein